MLPHGGWKIRYGEVWHGWEATGCGRVGQYRRRKIFYGYPVAWGRRSGVCGGCFFGVSVSDLDFFCTFASGNRMVVSVSTAGTLAFPA